MVYEASQETETDMSTLAPTKVHTGIVTFLRNALASLAPPQELAKTPYHFTLHDALSVASVVLSGKLQHNGGVHVFALQKEFAHYQKSKYALATSTGTAAIELALRALCLAPGDEVIVPAYTSISTIQAILATNCIPVFADIDDTFTVNPDSILTKLSSRTKVILPVHMFGNVADMDRIMHIARKHKMFVIEDCCQAVGAMHKNRRVGSIGDIGCFSFNAQKAIFCGQGGMLVTSKPSVIHIIQTSINEFNDAHRTTNSDIKSATHTHDMTEIQALLARIILKKLDSLNWLRAKHFKTLTNYITRHKLPFTPYRILPHVIPSYSRLVGQVPFAESGTSRKLLLRQMQRDGAPFKTYYPRPIYSYGLFQKKQDKHTKSIYPFHFNKNVEYRNMRLPFVEKFCTQQIGIGISPYMSETDLHKICTVLQKALSKIK